MDWLKGKRTYLTMVVMVVLGVIGSWNEYCRTDEAVSFCFNLQIPEWVYAILGMMGIQFRRISNTGK